MTVLAAVFTAALSPDCLAQKKVGLDNWYNHEINKKTNQVYHYTWEDQAASGFSELGKIFSTKGASIITVNSRAERNALKELDIYIIVDPDSTSENPEPNYILPEDVQAISAWVRKGGILLLMANDGPNCEFTHFNTLAETFGFRFNPVSLNCVEGKQWDMGGEVNLPGHPLFTGVGKIYMKEVSSITLSKKAKPVLLDGSDVFIAETKYGKGFVLAIGDPWLYNEYIDNNRLPESFENLKAANNLCEYLLSLSGK